MTNEVLMIGTMAFSLAVVLIAFKLGRSFLIAVIAINLAMVSLSAAKAGTVFGLVASPQTLFYSAIFLATDLLSEFHGKKAGYEAIWAGFLAQLLVALLGWVVVLFEPVPSASAFGDAADVVFSGAWRIALGSFVAYLIAQNFDVWFFHFLKEKTDGKRLWLRNNLSTATSQAIDTVIFFPIALGGVVENLGQIMLVAYVIKLIVAAVDTPFMYLARWLFVDDEVGGVGHVVEKV